VNTFNSIGNEQTGYEMAGLRPHLDEGVILPGIGKYASYDVLALTKGGPRRQKTQLVVN
jgi:hypothetical protein